MIERHLQRVDPTLQGRGAAPGRAERVRLLRPLLGGELPAAVAAEARSTRGFSRRRACEHIDGALDAGKGVILALPHLGGWEWAGRWLADQGHPITVVVEPLDPPELFDWFVDLRSTLGMHVVPLGSGAGTAVIRALRANEVVCLLSDRDIQRGGIEVEFFGERTTLPGGPATMALRTGAPLLPVGVVLHEPVQRPSRGRAPADPDRTARHAARGRHPDHADAWRRELELLIRRSPEQWHLFQPNWPSDPGYYD